MKAISKEGMIEMGKFFENLKKWALSLFGKREAVKQLLDNSFELASYALPYLDMASTIAAGITPSKVDDVALLAIKAKYPRLFDNSIKTGEELKLYTLGVATELLKAKFPDVSTSVARLAAQAAFNVKKASE